MIFFRQKINVILLVLPIEEISLRPELSNPPPFRIQGGGEAQALRSPNGNPCV